MQPAGVPGRFISTLDPEANMKLLVRRDQRAGLLGLGSVIFTLDVRAQITEDEWQDINTYKLNKTVLYSRARLVDRGSGLLGLASRLAFKAMNISICIDDLVKGKRIECKDVVEMLAVEDQIKEAATTFKSVLQAAAHFGGEEVVAI
jgi:hypothetical protein